MRLPAMLLDQEVVAMTVQEYEEYDFLTFQVPALGGYSNYHGVGFNRWRIGVTDSKGKFLGYLPILPRYLEYWVQLCYNVVYRQEQVRIYMEMMRGGPTNRKILQDILTQACVELRNYLFCRKAIMQEILEVAHSGEEGSLDVFDEYIIRERFDYHFMTEPKLQQQEYWGSNPFSQDMEGPMSKIHPFTFLRPTEFLQNCLKQKHSASRLLHSAILLGWKGGSPTSTLKQL